MPLTESQIKEAVWAVHSLHELSGCVVGYYSGNSCRTIGWPTCESTNSQNVAVIIEELGSDVIDARIVTAPTAPQIITNRSRLRAELLGMGGSCALAFGSAIPLVIGVGTEVVTGGLSTFLVIAGWTGFVMGAAQCANGIVRVGAAWAEPNSDSLDQWDKNQLYSNVMLVVDMIGVASGVASLPFSMAEFWKVLVRQRAFNAMNLSFDVLKRMNRNERLQTLAKVYKDAARGDGAADLARAAKKIHIGDKTLQFKRGLSVRHAEGLRRIVQDETLKRLHANLIDIIADSSGIAFSGTDPKRTASGSGAVYRIVHVIDTGEPFFSY